MTNPENRSNELDDLVSRARELGVTRRDWDTMFGTMTKEFSEEEVDIPDPDERQLIQLRRVIDKYEDGEEPSRYPEGSELRGYI